MYNYLIDHAVRNVWCNNEQDNQLIFQAFRVSKQTGELNNMTIMKRRLGLPVLGKYYHIFQIGQVATSILGLLEINPLWIIETWRNFSESMNKLKLFVNLYTNEGIEIPKFTSYYMYTKERALLIAVEADSNIVTNLQQENIFLRLYSNAFFASTRADTSNETIVTQGVCSTDTKTLEDWNKEYLKYKNLPVGHTFCNVNGVTVDILDSVTYKPGDTIEFIYDGSVKRVVEWIAGDLKTYRSTLDSKNKFLLHYPSAQNDTIDYQDDVDIHIFFADLNHNFGLYYPRNADDNIRMVTHRDYGIPVDSFDYIANSILSLGIDKKKNELKIQLVIRQSGYYRPLIYDNNRILELYKLSDTNIVNAMLDVNSTVDVWKAENLENSGYTAIMRSRYIDINIRGIQEGYGYNSMSKVLGDTPQKPTLVGGNKSIQLPYGLMFNSTVYEYDKDGLLLESHYHDQGSEYVFYNSKTEMAEVIYGKGSNSPGVIFGEDLLKLPSVDNFRVYLSFPNSSTPGKWRDITSSVYFTTDSKDTLIWTGVENDQLLMVRNDREFLDYDIDLYPVAGTLYFSLSELGNRDGVVKNYTLPVPLGELDIFLNGHSLIRGLDYYIDFPLIYIVNKSFLKQPFSTSPQRIHVRFTGFCDEQLNLDAIEDYGFIEHGVFSNNGKFDVRDDKVMRITVNGSLKHRDDIIFSELHSGISVTDPINGWPYQIKDIVVPMRGLTEENTYTLRNKSIAIDKIVSDYMTLKLPEPPRKAVSAIVKPYALVSPFIAHLINDMQTGLIDNTKLFNAVSQMDVLAICKGYEFLLPFDPIYGPNKVNPYYTVIYPHGEDSVVNLTAYQYKFLLKVIDIYGNDKIQLSPFLTFTPI